MSGPFESHVPGRHVDRMSPGGLRHWKQNEDRPSLIEGGGNGAAPVFDANDTKEMMMAKLNAVVRDLYQGAAVQGDALAQVSRIIGGISSDDIGIEVDPVSKRSHWQVKKELLEDKTFTVLGTKALFKVVMLRAYYRSSGALVPANVGYNAGSMMLLPTWDYPRAHE